MKIRRITRFSKNVFDAVLKLLPQLTPETELLSEEEFKKILKSGNIYLFIAELEKKHIVGMLTICTNNLLSGKKAWIEDVVVDESQRGKGFGRELTEHAINFSKSLGAKSLMLTSRPSRITANKLYSSLGFVKYETNVYRYNIGS
jgi:ribosomal protein S18 acetylase RimI-like enzyme